MTPDKYEEAISSLARDLRMAVAPALDQSGENHEWLCEYVHNAADMLQHNLTVFRMVRSILTELKANVDARAQALLLALERVIEAAEPPKEDWLNYQPSDGIGEAGQAAKDGNARDSQ